jgi:3-oxoacyl-[acyl-carrier protein] reductase
MVSDRQNWLDFTGKVTLVTGGSTGIGAECCRILGTMGAKVAINHYYDERGTQAAIKLVKDIENSNGIAIRCQADVSKPDEVARMFQMVEGQLGTVDILICSAGLTVPVAFQNLDYDTWNKTMAVNLNGVFYCCRYAIPSMLAKGYGSIVVVGSAASIAGGGGGTHYAASKAGVEGLVRDLSREFISKGIRVNTVLPAAVDTDIFRERYPDPMDRERVAQNTPLGRMGTPQELANVVVFLASDRASYICGQHILVDGGRTFFK